MAGLLGAVALATAEFLPGRWSLTASADVADLLLHSGGGPIDLAFPLHVVVAGDVARCFLGASFDVIHLLCHGQLFPR